MFRNIIKSISTLVVVGKWNIHIFSPEWVKKNLFDGKEMQIAVALPDGPFQFKNNYFELTVTSNRIHFEILSEEEDAQFEAISALRTILRLLNQTPVSAFGFNFAYETDADMSRYFQDFGKNNELYTPFINTTIKREAKWSFIDESKKSMNITLLETNSNTFRIDVNYDNPITDCLEIMSLIDDDAVITSKRKECESFITRSLNINADK